MTEIRSFDLTDSVFDRSTVLVANCASKEVLPGLNLHVREMDLTPRQKDSIVIVKIIANEKSPGKACRR